VSAINLNKPKPNVYYFLGDKRSIENNWTNFKQALILFVSTYFTNTKFIGIKEAL